MSARFSLAALAGYPGELTAYKGYGVSGEEPNVEGAALEAKM